jgi:Holliday junction resolvasome RuvABC endonuclease subunit
MMAPPLPFTVLAIDPATTVSGWAYLRVDSLHPLKVTVLKHGTIDGTKIVRRLKDMLKIYQKQFCTLVAIYEEYSELIRELKPNVVCSEGAFACKFMSAFVSLTLAIHQLRRAAWSECKLDVVEVPPTISKKALTGSGAADKDAMRKAYMSVSFLARTDSTEISEHEIDAIAHGVGMIRRDFVGDVIQNAKKPKK